MKLDPPLLPRPSSSRDLPTLRPILPAPPRWNTPEFYFYYVVFSALLPMMLKCAWDFSSETHPNYKQYVHRLSSGWLFGRKLDNSDAQYRGFRNNVHILIPVSLLHTLLSHLLSPLTPPQNIAKVRTTFSLAFSILFLSVIHGASVLKILIIAGMNYAIVKGCKGHWIGPALVWIWNLGIMFTSAAWGGFPYRGLSESLAWLDAYNGLGFRWWNTFNFTSLRMISFAMDYYWQCSKPPKQVNAVQSHINTCNICSATHNIRCERARVIIDLPSQDYNLLNFFSYLLYVPLYLAGPIITFNDFIWQNHHPPKSITPRSTLIYGLRWIGVYLLMECMLHGFHIVAIKDAHAWGGFTPFQMSMVGYFNLKVIWLKLLIIWRFFRLWVGFDLMLVLAGFLCLTKVFSSMQAMADRIETTENMTRCMSDNYSAIDFWKNWHRSFNRWLVRYVYIPLGGSKYYIFNIFPTFTFVAIWHDIELKLLTWGWLVAIFILPEFLLRREFGKEKWKTRLGQNLRHVTAMAAVVNIFLMMTANLVGFAVGIDGIREMAGQIFRPSGVLFLIVTCVALFSGVQVMFEWREMEKRREWKVEK
ncbi:glycerol transporter [Rhizophlyctis rosea]|uniref:Glycerol transporter n=1 Tax=Rhizophlyctis rosea TaxID=64517 RepID=A0AAD5S4U6_9FUNG|nr:glycerol transporter [Rhizophlyctis rosea]